MVELKKQPQEVFVCQDNINTLSNMKRNITYNVKREDFDERER